MGWAMTDLDQSTIATALEQHLLHKGLHSYRLDGDNIRFGLNKVGTGRASSEDTC